MPRRLNANPFGGSFLLAVAIGVILLPLTEQSGSAADIGLPPGFTQTQFHDISEEAGLAVSYLSAAPAAPLGFPHFDVGVEGSFTAIHSNATYWQAVFLPNNPPHYLPVPKLRVRVGLPFGIDVGGSYAYVPGISVKVAGGEIKWAAFKGGVTIPAVAIRGTYTTLIGVSDISLQTYGADLNISKGFAIFTPYIGVGQIWIKSKETTSVITLSSETISRTRGFVGLQIGIPLVSFVAEAAFSTIATYTARLSVGF